LGYVASAILAYLLGSIPVARLVGRRRGVFVEEASVAGSGTLAAYSELGRGQASLVFAGEACKGLVAALIGLGLAGEAGSYIALGAAIVGNQLPFFGRILGGRGVSTFIGGALVLNPFAWLIAVEFGVIVWLASTGRHAIWLWLLSLPIWQLLTDPSPAVAGTFALLAILAARWLALRREAAEPEAEKQTKMAKRRADMAQKLADKAEKQFATARKHTSRANSLAAQAQRLSEQAQQYTDSARPEATRLAEEEKTEPSALETEVEGAASKASNAKQRATRHHTAENGSH
jgi:acyl phosphate:glycerol-3-phosphate acyltransferase